VSKRSLPLAGCLSPRFLLRVVVFFDMPEARVHVPKRAAVAWAGRGLEKCGCRMAPRPFLILHVVSVCVCARDCFVGVRHATEIVWHTS